MASAFEEFVKPYADNHILLVLDNHDSQVRLKVYAFCRKILFMGCHYPPIYPIEAFEFNQL